MLKRCKNDHNMKQPVLQYEVPQRPIANTSPKLDFPDSPWCRKPSELLDLGCFATAQMRQNQQTNTLRFEFGCLLVVFMYLYKGLQRAFILKGLAILLILLHPHCRRDLISCSRYILFRHAAPNSKPMKIHHSNSFKN